VRYVLLAALGASLLAGCGGRPTGVLLPTAIEQSDAKPIEILAVTTRGDEGVPTGEMFDGSRGSHISYASISISIPTNRVAGEVQWPSTLPGDPKRDFVTVSADKLAPQAAHTRMQQQLAKTKHRRVLVFVHGYNTRFEESVYRLAQIVHDSDAPAVPILFTWPSRGQLLGYTYDRESANFSRDALEDLLRGLARNPAVGEITLLAHSMGNWVALEALRQMSIRSGRIDPKIKTVMMAAPDVDVDVFRRQVEAIGPKRPPFVIFVSRDDRALALSTRIWGNNPRLGAIDLKDPRYSSLLTAKGLQIVDLTELKSGDRLNHGKFAENPEIVRLIGGRLAAGQILHETNSGLGDRIGLITTGAAAAVGRAAAVTLSAPIALIDPQTRRNLPNQIDELGEDARQAARNAGAVIPAR
jgi:esterase/lipase superfamily enzyme